MEGGQETEDIGQAEDHARRDRGQPAEEEYGVPSLRDAEGDGNAGLEEGRPDGASSTRSSIGGCYGGADPVRRVGGRRVGGMVRGGRLGRGGCGRGCSGGAPAGAGLGGGSGGGLCSSVAAVGGGSALSGVRPRLMRSCPGAVVHQRCLSSPMEHEFAILLQHEKGKGEKGVEAKVACWRRRRWAG